MHTLVPKGSQHGCESHMKCADLCSGYFTIIVRFEHSAPEIWGKFFGSLSRELRGDFYFIFSYAWFKFLWATLTPHEVTIKWTHKDDSSIEFFLAMINHLLSFHLCQSQYNLQFKTEMQFNRRTCFTWIHFI